MWTRRWSAPRVLACAVLVAGLLAAAAQGDDEAPPSESQCRPYIEKALKELEGGDPHSGSDEDNDGSEETITSQEQNNDGEPPDNDSGENDLDTADVQNEDDDSKEGDDSLEVADEPYTGEDSKEDEDDSKVDEDDSKDDGDDSKDDSKENDDGDSAEKEEEQDDADSKEIDADDNNVADDDDDDEKTAEEDDSNEDSKENVGSVEAQDDDDSKEADTDEIQDEDQVSKESIEDIEADAGDDGDNDDDSKEENQPEEESDKDSKSKEGSDDDSGEKVDDKESSEDQLDSKEDDNESEEGEDAKPDSDGVDDSKDDTAEDEDSADDSDEDGESGEDKDEIPEEDLLKVSAIPANLKSRDHITQILRLDDESSENEVVVERSADIILRDLKRIYENNIKPLEGLYKYRDLSNRHFGDPEIFSKPLLLLMGPWSGGKSSIINYLTDIEFTEWSLRTGAEPSPAYFNILMHGKEPQVLDGTQLAADWTFSGLQKFGQGLEERLRGLKYPSKILEKINIVEIPGILEVRKQVSRVFPFNDACQWFIDRADIIFLVYDPSKLDVGPETEAILDQLKGRESQVRIVLNKADIVKPEELLRVQGALIWNISPLMSSAAPPALYAASLWARPLAAHAPGRLLAAQERALLTDLRSAIDRRIDNKIASARRFAVRVRNHAKMVDCYLTTYYNHKTIFGNKKVIAEAIIEHPQNYHIYEGLSTLTNISRYDLPDPETYKDFFRLNALYDFQPLSSTCTYFRGCPINRLDIAIAYDLPELVGKYKKMVESAVPQGMPKS